MGVELGVYFIFVWDRLGVRWKKMNLFVMFKFVYDIKNLNNIEWFYGEEFNWYDWFKEYDCINF